MQRHAPPTPRLASPAQAFPIPTTRPRPAPAIPPAKWRRRHEMPPPPEILCALPGGIREAWRPAWPARPCRPGKTAKQKGAGPHRLGLLGPPPPAPRIPRHPRAPATTYRASDASDVLTGSAAAPTALTTPCGVPDTGVPVRDRGPRERPRALGAGPSAGHALCTRPSSTRSRSLGEARPIPTFISESRPVRDPVVQ